MAAASDTTIVSAFALIVLLTLVAVLAYPQRRGNAVAVSPAASPAAVLLPAAVLPPAAVLLPAASPVASSAGCAAPRSRVLVVGTFDMLHDGHRALFHAALAFGHELVVGVTVEPLRDATTTAQDVVRQPFVERAAAIQALPHVTHVFADDENDAPLTKRLAAYVAKYDVDVVLSGEALQELRIGGADVVSLPMPH